MLKITKKTNQTPQRLILATEELSSLTSQFMQLLLPWYSGGAAQRRFLGSFVFGAKENIYKIKIIS